MPGLDRVLPLRGSVAPFRGGLHEPTDHIRRHHRLVLAAQERDPPHAVASHRGFALIRVGARGNHVVDTARDLALVPRDMNRRAALVLEVHDVRSAFADDEADLDVWDVNLALLPFGVEGGDCYAVFRGRRRHREGFARAAEGPSGRVRDQRGGGYDGSLRLGGGELGGSLHGDRGDGSAREVLG